MALVDIIDLTIELVKGVYKVAVIIYESEYVHKELRDAAKHASIILNTVEDILCRWEKFAYRVSVDDQEYIRKYTNHMKTLITTIENVLKGVQVERNAIQRLVMKTNEYKQKLSASVNDLTEVHRIVDSATSRMPFIEVDRRELTNFRRSFQNLLDKEISKFNFSFVENTPTTVSMIALREFDPTTCPCYIQIHGEALFIGYHRRVWLATKPKMFILDERRKQFRRHGHGGSSANCTDGTAITHGLPSDAVVTDIDGRKLHFKELSMTSDHICGIASTRSIIYIATKHEIKVVQSTTGATIAQYRGAGDGFKAFKHISYIYIDPNDEKSLYIVDCGHYAVHRYQINDAGHCFQYIGHYVIIANVNQKCNIVSCVIHKTNLYVSDNGNNCLHVFPLKGERQFCYLIDPAMHPFSPGPLSAYGDYLYVTISLSGNTSILVLDEECHPVDWFRHQSLREILAIDIDRDLKELFILTTTIIKGRNNTEEKWPLVVSMDLSLRSSNSSNKNASE